MPDLVLHLASFKGHAAEECPLLHQLVLKVGSHGYKVFALCAVPKKPQPNI